MPGSYGPNCNLICPTPTYGKRCQNICHCVNETCNPSTGCTAKTTGTWYCSLNNKDIQFYYKPHFQ